MTSRKKLQNDVTAYETRPADPFADILKLTSAESVVSGGFTAGGAWAIRFPEMQKLKFSAIVKGACWLSIDGERTPVRVEAGDVFLLSAQRSFVLASELGTDPIDAASLFGANGNSMPQLGDGADCLQVGGFIKLDQVSGGLLTDVLPPLIHVRARSPQAVVLQWLLDQLVREQAAELPGASLASATLPSSSSSSFCGDIWRRPASSLPAGCARSAIGTSRQPCA